MNNTLLESFFHLSDLSHRGSKPSLSSRSNSRPRTRFYHLFLVMRVAKYCYKVLPDGMRERSRPIVWQTCQQMGVHIMKGVLARDHVQLFLSMPSTLSLAGVMHRSKGHPSHRIQME